MSTSSELTNDYFITLKQKDVCHYKDNRLGIVSCSSFSRCNAVILLRYESLKLIISVYQNTLKEFLFVYAS